MRKFLRTLAVLSLIGSCSTSRVHADDDFAARNRSWNGLSGFLSLVAESGVKTEAVEHIDISTLSRDDAILIVHPTKKLPIHGLTRFMKNGGRLAVLDDFGASHEFLRAFEFGRFAPVVNQKIRRLRDNDNLLVALPAGGHPLTEKVSALVANHPQTLYHNELKPVFAFEPSGRTALVLVGAIGDGRLVAISDSSLLINNMLEFHGNRIFARNLVRYLIKDNPGRLFVSVWDASLIDVASDFTPRNSLDGVRQALVLISRYRLAPSAVYTLTVIVLTLLLIVAAATFPHASPYIAYADLIKQPEVLAGYWGSVRFFSQRGRNLLNPLLVFRFELLEAIQQRLGLNATPTPYALADRLRAIDIPESDIDELQRLLRELDALHSQRDYAAPVRINRRKFRNLVAKGTHMLHRLDTMVKNRETRG